MNVAATLLDGARCIAVLAPQLYQQQHQLFVCAAEQIASGHVQILKASGGCR